MKVVFIVLGILLSLRMCDALLQVQESQVPQLEQYADESRRLLEEYKKTQN